MPWDFCHFQWQNLNLENKITDIIIIIIFIIIIIVIINILNIIIITIVIIIIFASDGCRKFLL